MGRPHAPSTFSWGAGIWSTERKDPPARLSEVLPSPTSTVPPGGSGGSFFGGDAGITQAARDQTQGAQIPFAIPLHPTPKTYRSQSYSVGQLDPEMSSPTGMSSSAMMGRTRHPALQHRPSRPSMLSEMANDGSMLGKVKEVDDDDDDESASESMQGSFHQNAETKSYEMLARENAILRQQQQQYSARLRPRASTSGGYPGNGYALHESVPEESDFAVDELDEGLDVGESLARRAATRRMSEYGGGLRSGMAGKYEQANLKKALWTTSLGFPLGETPQSRRHSFANMPTRQGSISSIADSASALDHSSSTDAQPNQGEFGSGYTDMAMYSQGSGGPSFYPSAAALQPGLHSAYPSPYVLQQQYANRAPSPHRSVYNVGQPRHNQLLHVVLFKCARADVFYIQEGTGLAVKPGDLVIVEADRGTDLGTVAKDNVDWQTAKEMKEHYAEEHYKWLMMYSQGAAAAQDGSGIGSLSSQSGLQGSAVGGMGPPTQHHMQEPNAGELRPKLIKRLAQSHEVHSLRDKEGQEAKAKRVCMQKVKEHGLNMEILDAEFQMDWKKLTFYYFADAYINFNSLVTDLFKIYKTRIWMSAINPASFASPTLGIQAPSGIGPGAVGVGRASGGGQDRRHAPAQEQQNQNFAAPAGAGRGFRSGMAQPFIPQERSALPTGFPPSGFNFGHGGAFGNARTGSAYVASPVPGVEGLPGGYQQPPDYQTMRNRFAASQGAPSPVPPPAGMPMAQGDWNAAFQGLSLNSH
jgi:cell fate regulator YaaT (PSP1 superfamily)